MGAPTTEVQLRRAVAVLAVANTDEQAARTMGVSLRTYRRYLALAYAALGARTRFQAGVAAVRTGWLNDDGGD